MYYLCVFFSSYSIQNNVRFFVLLCFLSLDNFVFCRLSKCLVAFLLLLQNALVNSNTFYPFRICCPRMFLKSIHYILKHLALFNILKPKTLGSIQQLSPTNKVCSSLSNTLFRLRNMNWWMNVYPVVGTKRLVQTVKTHSSHSGAFQNLLWSWVTSKSYI